MKCNLIIRFFALYICLCAIQETNGQSDDSTNDNDSQKLHRKKETANYFYSKPLAPKFFNYKVKSRRDDSDDGVNKEPNHMLRVKDLAILNKNHIARRNKGKKDPIAEEEINPNREPIFSRKSKKSLPILEATDGAGDRLSLPDCGTTDDLGERIVNGKNAPEGAHPWIAVILKSGDAWCGGSIINERWVISAAHCFMGDQTGATYAIRVGNNNRNDGTAYKVEKVISHERFNLDNMLNSDIALLKISKPIKFGKTVKPICFPHNSYDEPHRKTLVVAGWGQLTFENADQPVMLQDVTLNIINDGECSRKFKRKKYTIYRSQVCTWNYKQDACQGDSGGPAMETVDGRVYLIGLVSYGSTCADEFPGVYTQVSYFLNWIASTLKKN